MNFISMLLTFSILCLGCGSFHSDDSATHPAENPSKEIPTEQGLVEQEVDTSLDTGFMIDQILESTDGAIHYSY